MVPKNEECQWLFSIATALHYGHHGNTSAGYKCLLDGLRQAERARDAGNEWGEELARRYKKSLAIYAERFGITLSSHLV